MEAASETTTTKHSQISARRLMPVVAVSCCLILTHLLSSSFTKGTMSSPLTHREWCPAKELNVSKRKNSSSETTTGGKANKTGNQLENFVEQNLQDYGYTEFWNYKAIAFENRKSIGGRQYLKGVPIGTTIYETVRKCDFLVINNQKFPDNLIIECKWQQS